MTKKYLCFCIAIVGIAVVTLAAVGEAFDGEVVGWKCDHASTIVCPPEANSDCAGNLSCIYTTRAHICVEGLSFWCDLYRGDCEGTCSGDPGTSCYGDLPSHLCD